MELVCYNHKRASALQNMLDDCLMLESSSVGGAVRFRHYGWGALSWTFGCNQPYEWAKAQADPGALLCRRPSAGGLVNHNDDWTFSLVIGPTHPLYKAKAAQSYKVIHLLIADIFSELGVSAALAPASKGYGPGESSLESVCFTTPVEYDVIDLQSGLKIAGAAQKRNAHGLLFQGSISRLKSIDWISFEALFKRKLLAALDLSQIIEAGALKGDIALSPSAQKMLDSNWLKKR